jgi:hypothetical protein
MDKFFIVILLHLRSYRFLKFLQRIRNTACLVVHSLQIAAKIQQWGWYNNYNNVYGTLSSARL